MVLRGFPRASVDRLALARAPGLTRRSRNPRELSVGLVRFGSSDLAAEVCLSREPSVALLLQGGALASFTSASCWLIMVATPRPVRRHMMASDSPPDVRPARLAKPTLRQLASQRLVDMPEAKSLSRAQLKKLEPAFAAAPSPTVVMSLSARKTTA